MFGDTVAVLSRQSGRFGAINGWSRSYVRVGRVVNGGKEMSMAISPLTFLSMIGGGLVCGLSLFRVVHFLSM